jgi:hypothetical protein
VTSNYSDERLKTNLGRIKDAVSKIKSLSGFYYEPNETAMALGYKKVVDVGVSAQKVKEVLPEVVAPAPIDEKYLTVRYEKMVPLIIEAIKEQQDQIDNIKDGYTNPPVSSNASVIDLSAATIFNISLTENITSFIINNATESRVNKFTLFLTQNDTGGNTVNWTFSDKTLKWAGGNAPTITSTANKTDIYEFISNDGGNTWYGFVKGQNF